MVIARVVNFIIAGQVHIIWSHESLDGLARSNPTLSQIRTPSEKEKEEWLGGHFSNIITTHVYIFLFILIF